MTTTARTVTADADRASGLRTGAVFAGHLAVIVGTTVGRVAGGSFAVPLAATADPMIPAARRDDPDVETALPIPQSAEPAS